MKKMLLVLVAGLLATPVLASTLNISVKSGGSSAVNASAGATVNFTVQGVLADNLNEGLALVGFDLHFTGGALAANTVQTPVGAVNCGNPMPAFVKPGGITNPVGYIGTLIGGDLIQIGGGQNTIKNSVDNPVCAPNCAPFPVGTPILGVAQPAVCGPAVIATGSLTAPNAPGVYHLQVLNAFANTIKDGEVLANAFLATEAAGVSVLANLQITVTTETECEGITSTVPANCSVDARRPHAPGPGAAQGYNSIALTFDHSCDVAGAAPGDFTVACHPAGNPCPTINIVNTVDHTVTVTFSGVIPAGKWTCVTHTGSSSNATKCIGTLPGDISGNLFTAAADILDLVDHLNGVRVPPLALDHCDMDRLGTCVGTDILTLIDMLNGANGFINWTGKSLAACPSP